MISSPELSQLSSSKMENSEPFIMTFDGGAHTLDTSEVSDLAFGDGCDPETLAVAHTKTHSDGWTITGYVHVNYASWVNDFEAKHPTHGWVKGNFDTKVTASSDVAYHDFYQNHTPRLWDYMDI